MNGTRYLGMSPRGEIAGSPCPDYARSRRAVNRSSWAPLPIHAPSVGQGIHHPPDIAFVRPLRQPDLWRLRRAVLLKRNPPACEDLVLGGLRQPIPFPVGLAQCALAALGFQFA